LFVRLFNNTLSAETMLIIGEWTRGAHLELTFGPGIVHLNSSTSFM